MRGEKEAKDEENGEREEGIAPEQVQSQSKGQASLAIKGVPGQQARYGFLPSPLSPLDLCLP